MEPIILSRDPLFFTDDFDIRVSDHNHKAIFHFFDLLELISLNRCASESTHELGHVLDLIITRNSDNFISGQRMSDILFSGNLTLLFKLKTA